MYMWVEFEVTSECVDDGHNGRSVAKLTLGVQKNGAGGCLHQDIEANFSVDLNNWPEYVGDGEDDMLIGDVEKCFLIFINPVIGLDCPAAGAESGFAREVNLLCQLTAKALKRGITKTDFALKNFANIDEDRVTDTLGVFINKSIPVAVGAKNVSN